MTDRPGPGRPEEPAVDFTDVGVTLGGVSILENVTATVPAESSTAIVGPNGAGKTTLLLTLLGQVPHTGSVRIARTSAGKPFRLGYVPQRLSFDRGLPVTVLEFMTMGRQRLPFWFGCREPYRQEARELLASVMLEGLEKRPLGALSGGELQRLLLALALQQQPDLLVLDEPAAGVDFRGEHILCELLDNLRRRWKLTLLMISHDLATVTHHATHVILLNRKVAAQGPPREVLTHQNLMAVFGLHMGLVDAGAMPACPPDCPAHRRKEAGHA